MPTEYLAVTHPEDGDAATAESVNVGFRRLAQLIAAPLMNLASKYTAAGTVDMFYDVAFGPSAGSDSYGQFLAVGIDAIDGYRYASSYDGETWTAPAPSSPDILLCVAHGGTGTKKWVIGGRTALLGAQLWTSPEAAVSLTEESMPGGGSLHGVVWEDVNDVWCAVGYNGTIMTSPSAATTWTLRTAASSYAGQFARVIALSTGRLVAIGEAGEIQTSDNAGVTWTRRRNGGEALPAHIIDLGNGILLASFATRICRSTDYGTSWSNVASPPVATVEMMFEFDGVVAAVFRVAAQNRQIQLSFDQGLTFPVWSRVAMPLQAYTWNAYAKDESRVVVVGGDFLVPLGAVAMCSPRSMGRL